MGFGVALAGDGHAAAHGLGSQIAVPLAGLREARGQGAGGAGKKAAFLTAPRRPQKGRDGILFQRSGGSKGVAGEAEHQLAVNFPGQHGASGLLGHARKEDVRIQLFQHSGQIVFLPHRDAAAGDDGIALRQQFPHLAGDLLRVVGAVPTVYRKAQLPQAGGVLDAVGVVNFAGRPSLARS